MSQVYKHHYCIIRMFNTTAIEPINRIPNISKDSEILQISIFVFRQPFLQSKKLHPLSHFAAAHQLSINMDYATSLANGTKLLYPRITDELLRQLLKLYGKNGWNLLKLDRWRAIDFPAELSKRYSQGCLSITKDELALLMDWKLAKGKFRPSLPKLIQGNSEEAVEKATKSGFLIFTSYATKHANWLDVDLHEYQEVLRLSLKRLTELRGVGPATASLLLAVLKDVTPLAPPFFSDEAFLYFVQEPLRPGQPIKYNVKEYADDFLLVMIGVARKYNIEFLEDLEKGAWALKLYHSHRNNRLADVELPANIDEKLLDKFDAALDFIVEAVPKKRAAPAVKKSNKRTKTEPESNKVASSTT